MASLSSSTRRCRNKRNRWKSCSSLKSQGLGRQRQPLTCLMPALIRWSAPAPRETPPVSYSKTSSAHGLTQWGLLFRPARVALRTLGPANSMTKRPRRLSSIKQSEAASCKSALTTFSRRSKKARSASQRLPPSLRTFLVTLALT